MKLTSEPTKSKNKVPVDNSAEEFDFLKIEKNNLYEQSFRSVIESHLEDNTFKLLEKNGFSEDEIEEFRKIFLNLSKKEREYVISYPYALKIRNLQGSKNLSPEKRIELFVKGAIMTGEKDGRIIGFHASPSIILPNDKEKVGETMRTTTGWTILGTEPDHRDNDIFKAYYSLDYLNIYREKNPKYIYPVAVLTKTGTHKKDANKWGRASRLDVIDQFDIKEIDKEVVLFSKSFTNKEKGEQEKEAA